MAWLPSSLGYWRAITHRLSENYWKRPTDFFSDGPRVTGGPHSVRGDRTSARRAADAAGLISV